MWPTGLAGLRQLGDRRCDAHVALRLGRTLRGPRDEIPSGGDTHALTLRTPRIPACLEWGVLLPRRGEARCRTGLSLPSRAARRPETPEEIDELVAWDTQVAEEDVALVEAVQRGLDSEMVPQGP